MGLKIRSHVLCNLPLIRNILAVTKVGHLNIKTKIFNFEASALIGWLVNILVSQPIRTRASE